MEGRANRDLYLNQSGCKYCTKKSFATNILKAAVFPFEKYFWQKSVDSDMYFVKNKYKSLSLQRDFLRRF